MPEEMTFDDLRNGTDVEFGQSIYEPFGIAQVEPLAAGALCVVSNVCGCVGFVARAAGEQPTPNLIVADYVGLPPGWNLRSAWDALRIDRVARNNIEAYNSLAVAQQIAERSRARRKTRRATARGGPAGGARDELGCGGARLSAAGAGEVLSRL